MSTAEEIDKRFADRGHPLHLGRKYRDEGGLVWQCTARGFMASDWYAELTWMQVGVGKPAHMILGGAPFAPLLGYEEIS